ncbi:ATP-binding protein [Hydrocarboniphaga sp.]|uniref:ATP-binding protein n=1 Tax=Hydrocarboniphaga sp. TaxID=2033016 RepID=UPI003D0B8E32
MSKARLLVASKTPAAQSALVAALEAAQYTLSSAGDVEQARAQIADSDLLLIDHDHLEADGLAFAAQLRTDASLKLPPLLHIAADLSGKAFHADDACLNASAQTPALLSMIAALLSARRAERLKDDFLSTVSHELRTPLNSILGWSDILMRQPRDADATQGLASIERNARLQAQMIADLLDASRMLAGRFEIELSPIDDLGFVIDGAIKSAAEAARPRQITITRQVEAGLPAVRGDSERLQQIVGNLLSNAIKFSAKGGSVGVDLRRDGDSLQISVSDSGRGIAADKLALLLSQARSGSGDKSRGGGLGLGLSIAVHLAELHRGSLAVHSDGIGKGARFTLRLPLAG